MYFHSKSVQVFTVKGRRKDEEKMEANISGLKAWTSDGGRRGMVTESKRQSERKHGGREWPVTRKTKVYGYRRMILVMLQATHQIEGTFQYRKNEKWK